MAKRLTAEQRAERDFWLGVAETEDMRLSFDGVVGELGLCGYVVNAGAPSTYREHLDLFRPVHDYCAWWWPLTDREDKRGNGRDRVLAACFLAAMAESGDL